MSQAPAPHLRPAIRRDQISVGTSAICRLRQLVPAIIFATVSGAAPAPAAGAEPFCDWLDGLGAAAQARSDGLDGGELHARRALTARPAGDAASRAQLALGLALGGSAAPADRVSALRAGLKAAPFAARGAVLSALGDALLASGDAHAAAQSFREAAAEGTGAVARRARLRTAAALHAEGLAGEALAAWRPLVPDRLAASLEPEDRIAFAQDLRSTGDAARAAEILRSIWSDQPERSAAAEAEAILSAWREAGARIPPFSGEERVARAFRLISVGRAGDGRAELDRAAQADPPAPPELLTLAGAQALLALGRPAEAVQAVQLLTSAASTGIRRGASLIQARAAARERRIPDAIAAWRAVAAGSAPVPGLPPAAQATLRDDAAYFAAWLNFDAGDPSRAASELARLAREHPGSRRAEDARWFSAWAHLRAGETALAEVALRRAEVDGSLPRVRYWRARIATEPEATRALLASVATADPLGYYGILSCVRLRAGGWPCPAPPLAPGRPLPELAELSDAPQLRQAALLASLGLRDEALAELAAIAGANGGRRAAPLAAELALHLGDPLLPFRVARDQLGLSRRTLAWAFPAAWPPLVDGAARAAGIDPSLLRAIMRRESGFRTDARSPAGAVGLLQIVPSTAARLAALLRLPPPLADRLEDPSINVPLGAGYFGLLLERFGDPLVAIAAYNAGPNAVLRWSRDRSPQPLDVWVESIPFRETRQYVRAVVENWAGARAAAGDAPPELDPDRVVPAPGPGVGF